MLFIDMSPEAGTEGFIANETGPLTFVVPRGDQVVEVGRFGHQNYGLRYGGR